MTAAGNQAPTVPTNTGLALNEGATATITATNLAAADVNDCGVNLTFTVTSGPVNGSLLVNGVAATSFTQADIAANLVHYVHNGSETLSDSFTFTVTDSAASATAPQTFNITVTAV